MAAQASCVENSFLIKSFLQKNSDLSQLVFVIINDNFVKILSFYVYLRLILLIE